jgi:DnaK suppressor protein
LNFLSPNELKKLASELCLRREKLLAEIRDHLHRSDDPNMLTLSNHLETVGDWVEADLFNDIDIAVLHNELVELRHIDAALMRMKAGTYGICSACRKPISAKRMEAQVMAEYCLNCQENLEERDGNVGSTTL